MFIAIAASMRTSYLSKISVDIVGFYKVGRVLDRKFKKNNDFTVLSKCTSFNLNPINENPFLHYI